MNQRTTNTSPAENFTRSANAPTMSAGVIAAKVSWNATKASSGITTPLEKVAATASAFTPDRNIFENPPKKALPLLNATEYP